MSKNNPFCLSFGREPERFVDDSLECTAKTFSVQRDRLIKKGILDGSEYGVVSLLLPRFDAFVKMNSMEE